MLKPETPCSLDGKEGDPGYPLTSWVTSKIVDVITIDAPRVSAIIAYLSYARIREMMRSSVSPANVVDILQTSNCSQAPDEVLADYREPLAFSHFHADLGIDPRKWRHRSDRHALFQEIWRACTMASMARHGQALPFVLDL